MSFWAVNAAQNLGLRSFAEFILSEVEGLRMTWLVRLRMTSSLRMDRSATEKEQGRRHDHRRCIAAACVAVLAQGNGLT
jgi:hypothetical protein